MRNSIAIFVVSLATMGVLLAGCGGNGDSAEAQQIDKATFVKQANQICERVSGKMAVKFTSLRQEAANPNVNLAKTAIVMTDVLIPGLEEELQQIRALGMPPEAKQETEALLEVYKRVIGKIKANPKAAATQSLSPYESIELAGTRFGVDECPVAPVNAS